MIADLRGRTVLLAAVPPPLAQAFEKAFVAHGAACVRAEAVESENTLELFRSQRLDALICGRALPATNIASVDDYQADTLARTITEGAWPAFAWLQRMRATHGHFPRYAVVLSAMTPDHFVTGADFSAASEAVLETLCRYVNERLSGEDMRMNILRHRLAPEIEAGRDPHFFVTPEEVANAAVALCSGLLDSMRGQVLTVDRGGTFGDNVFRRFEQRTAQ
jgi:NAD(P)-dependent dehydrogenase (short-subunit alcohol dehydrogenase family)